MLWTDRQKKLWVCQRKGYQKQVISTGGQPEGTRHFGQTLIIAMLLVTVRSAINFAYTTRRPFLPPSRIVHIDVHFIKGPITFAIPSIETHHGSSPALLRCIMRSEPLHLFHLSHACQTTALNFRQSFAPTQEPHQANSPSRWQGLEQSPVVVVEEEDALHRQD